MLSIRHPSAKIKRRMHKKQDQIKTNYLQLIHRIDKKLRYHKTLLFLHVEKPNENPIEIFSIDKSRFFLSHYFQEMDNTCHCYLKTKMMNRLLNNLISPNEYKLSILFNWHCFRRVKVRFGKLKVHLRSINRMRLHTILNMNKSHLYLFYNKLMNDN